MSSEAKVEDILHWLSPLLNIKTWISESWNHIFREKYCVPFSFTFSLYWVRSVMESSPYWVMLNSQVYLNIKSLKNENFYPARRFRFVSVHIKRIKLTGAADIIYVIQWNMCTAVFYFGIPSKHDDDVFVVYDDDHTLQDDLVLSWGSHQSWCTGKVGQSTSPPASVSTKFIFKS